MMAIKRVGAPTRPSFHATLPWKTSEDNPETNEIYVVRYRKDGAVWRSRWTGRSAWQTDTIQWMYADRYEYYRRKAGLAV